MQIQNAFDWALSPIASTCANAKSSSARNVVVRSSSHKRKTFIATFALIMALACSRAAEAAIAVDAVTSQNQDTASATVSSPLLSTTAAHELLLAFIATDSPSTPNIKVQSLSGAGVVWTLVVRTNTQQGTSEIWRALAPAVVRNAMVVAKLSQSAVSSITVASFSGVATTGINGAGAIGAVGSGNSPQGAPSASLVTTADNSFVVGVGNDYDAAIARTPAAGQALFHQNLSSTGDTYWVQRLNGTIAHKGTIVTLADTAPKSDRFNFSTCEILPAVSNAGPQLSLSSTALNFSDVALGSSATSPLTLSSTGTSPLTIKSAALVGSGFGIIASGLPITLAPGKSLALQFQFVPESAGLSSGQVTIGSDAGSNAAAVVSLSGTATSKADGRLSVVPATLSFGSVNDGTAATQTIKLTSIGTTTVTVSSESIAGAGYSVVGGSATYKLAPKQSATLTIQFAPKAAGAVHGDLTLVSNSVQGSPMILPLHGTGAASHEVSLSWDAPSSSPVPVAGYHIYRAPVGGTFLQINASLDVQTSYVDSSVTGGATYEYEVRSVGDTGVESSSSNQITESVP
jgi:hypothetical protein